MPHGKISVPVRAAPSPGSGVAVLSATFQGVELPSPGIDVVAGPYGITAERAPLKAWYTVTLPGKGGHTIMSAHVTAESPPLSAPYPTGGRYAQIISVDPSLRQIVFSVVATSDTTTVIDMETATFVHLTVFLKQV